MRGRNIISERGGAGRQWGGAGRTGVKIGRFEAVDRDCVVVARKSNAEVLIMTIKDREWAVVQTLERSLHSVTTNEDMTAVGQIFRNKHKELRIVFTQDSRNRPALLLFSTTTTLANHEGAADRAGKIC